MPKETEQSFEPHHSFFPELRSQLVQEAAVRLGITPEIVIAPRIGMWHTPNPEVQNQSAVYGLKRHKDNLILLYPPLSDMLERYLSVATQEERDIFLLSFREKILHFLNVYGDTTDSEIPAQTKSLLDTVERIIGGHTSLLRFVSSKLDYLSFTKNEPLYQVFFAIVALPLLESNLQLQEVMMEIMRLSAVHEAAHARLALIVENEVLTSDENDIIDHLLNDEEWEKLKVLIEDFSDGISEAEAEYLIKIQGIVKLKALLDLINDPVLRQKAAFTYLWKGFDENFARAITYAITSKEDELYNVPTLKSYYLPLGVMMYAGNDHILELVEMFKREGIVGCLEEAKAVKQYLLKVADDIVQSLEE